MSLELFKVVERNPNEDVGGGGCVCSPETETSYCEGPYVVFYAASTDEAYSPHVVACKACIEAAAEALEYGEEVDGTELNL